MGCSSSDSSVSKPKKAKKPPKDYAADPSYQKFLECGAEGDPADPKKMFITKEKVRPALQAVGIETKEEDG